MVILELHSCKSCHDVVFFFFLHLEKDENQTGLGRKKVLLRSWMSFVFPLFNFKLQIKYLQFHRNRSTNDHHEASIQLTFFSSPTSSLHLESDLWIHIIRNCHVCRGHSILLDSLCMMFVVKQKKNDLIWFHSWYSNRERHIAWPCLAGGLWLKICLVDPNRIY